MDAVVPEPPDGAAAEREPRRDGRSRNWALAAIAALVVIVVYFVRYEILPFVIAGAIGFVFNPVIRWLTPRLGGHRWIPATVLSILVIALAAAAAYWIGSIAAADLSQLAQNGPQMLHRLLSQIIGPHGVSIFGQTFTADSLTKELQQKASAIVSPASYAKGLGLGIAALLAVFLTAVLIPYFMVSGPRLVRGMIWLLPPDRRAAVGRTLQRIAPVLRRYLVGIAIVIVATAVAAYLGFGLAFALPHAVLLSAAVGALEIIPALGPFTSLVLVGLTSLHQGSIGTSAALMAYAVFLRLGIDNVLGPLVLGQSAKLHPVAIIFAFVVGASLFGVLGLLLAVPTAACIVIVLEQYYAEADAQAPHP
jgi:predicted PurR-regulated permease PerM